MLANVNAQVDLVALHIMLSQKATSKCVIDRSPIHKEGSLYPSPLGPLPAQPLLQLEHAALHIIVSQETPRKGMAAHPLARETLPRAHNKF